MTEAIRIQKVISKAGIASRRAAEKLILEGSVTLNGETVTELGQRMVVGADRLEVDGRVVHSKPERQLIYALYKPKNCITSLHDPQGRPIIKDYFPKTNKQLFPVGRLDYDAEGLIFVTNDGDFANYITHPRHKMWKTYFVKVKGLVSKDTLRDLKQGPLIGKRKHLPVKAKILHTVNDKTWLEISLREGTNQQIKKMFGQHGYRVLKIKRFRIGNITLENLQPGQFRKLTKAEIDELAPQTT